MALIPESVRENPWVKAFIVITFFMLFLAFTYWIRNILLPFFMAFIIAYILDPVVDGLEKKLGIGRTLAVVLLLSAFSLLVLGFSFYLIDQAFIVAEKLKELAQNPPSVQEGIDAVVPRSVQQYFVGYVSEQKPQQLMEEALKFLRDRMTEIVNTLTQGSSYLWWLATRTFGAVGFLIHISVGLISAIYLLRDFDHIVQQTRTLIPHRYRPKVNEIVTEIDELMRAFFRGHLIVCVTVGILYGTGYELIGLKGGFLVGLLSGFMNVIPYLGPAAGFSAALVMGLFQFGLSFWLFGIVAVYVAVQSFEGNLLTPKIVGDAVGLHPVVVIFSMMVFGKILGFLGLLLAIPLTAILNVLLGHLIDQYKRTAFYNQTHNESAS